MAVPLDPRKPRRVITVDTDGVYAAGGGGEGGGATTISDGADVTTGAIADAVVAAGAAGSVSAKLRRLTTDLAAASAKLPATLGSKADAAALAVTQSTEDKAQLVTIDGSITSLASVTSALGDILDLIRIATETVADIQTIWAADTSASAIAGEVASDSADSGNPVKIGGIGKAAAPTAVTSLDRVNAWFSLKGEQFGTLAVDGAIIPGDATNGLKVNIANYAHPDAEYETVAASQTAQPMGTGAAGDYLSHVIVSPGTSTCGVVTILDNAITVVAFPGGATTALPSLIPFIIPVGITSLSGAWKITTGANVTCVGVGNFT